MHVQAQEAEHTEPCGYNHYINYLDSLNPGFKEHVDNLYKSSVTKSKQKTKFSVKDTVHTIRVVFHVVWNNGPENLPDEYIHSQMEVLNRCFRRQNADTVDTREIFKSVAGDAGIEFVLATEDPDGNPTTGIVRRQTSRTSFLTTSVNLSQADEVKFAAFGSEAWDPDKYLNIWVCDLSIQGQDRLLGYAYPPTNAAFWNGNSYAPQNRQGVVVHYKVVGEDNPHSFSTGAKTAVHEVGHYLGLRHTWGDAPESNRCAPQFDDFIDDTPLSGTSSGGTSICNTFKNTCNALEPNDLPDQIENYMDYSPGHCQNMFTNQQIAVMRNNLTTLRQGIYTSEFPPPPPVLPEGTAIGVYPNPVTTTIAISLGDLDLETPYTFKIISQLGQDLASIDLAAEQSQLIPYTFGFVGLHLYQITDADGKVMKQGKIVFSN
jgi:predicted Zn-dependent protease